MSDDFDYMKLLETAKAELGEVKAEEGRFNLPEVDSFIEGKTTIFRNFGVIVDMIARDTEHVLQHLIKDIGAPGVLDDSGRLIIKARVVKEDLQKKVDAYFETYVLCSECGRPDTHLIKEGRTQVVICDACGGRRPVHVKKASKQAASKDERLRAGDTIDVTVQDISRRGDGVARVGPYVIFVPGSAKGDRVKIRIEFVSNNNFVQSKVIKE
ncbi:MAG: translation initiation factor IF-2 subunit beta [Thermoplasmata archaeon]|nr:translation initiation factor IF-2 subunit beta [Thermoplasmata archaeon]